MLIVPAICIGALQSDAQLKGGKVQNASPDVAVKGDSYAVIFGISNYPGLPPLKYADKDAALFRDFLQTPAGGNVKSENIFFKVNEDAKAATFNITARNWLKSKKFKEGDRVYIYFSGHGDALNEENYYLLPYDCTPNNDPDNYLATGVIQMHTIKTLIIPELIRQKAEVLLIVDACRTNELPGGQQGQQSFANSVQSISEKGQGEIIMLSAGAGQSAIESPNAGGGHGLFTWYLVSGLSGDADKEGDAADQDGKVSLAEITSYVKSRVRKDAKTMFNANQVPVFLPPDRDLETIVVVDSSTYKNWQLAEHMRQQTGGNILASAGGKAETKGITRGTLSDTALITLDNKFISAIKSGSLTGKLSAEQYFEEMEARWPAQPITEDAKYTLATEFINFGQEKINLFLSGKGIVHVQHMESEYTANKNGANKKMPPGMAEQLERMRTLTATGFDKAATMMEKAVKLLKNNPDLLEPIYPKLYFLQAAELDNRNNYAARRQAITLLKKAIQKDSAAAYNYQMLGHVYFMLKNDSSGIYFRKAKELAPKWADPENGLANYYSEIKQYDQAIMHYHEAVRLDTLDALAFQNIGVLYSNENKLDSAKKYFLKGLAIDPCDRYANSNMGSLHASDMTTNRMDDPNFEPAEKYMKKAMSCDSGFSRAYFQLAGLFAKVNRRDSSMYFLKRGIAVNPDDASLYRALGDEYFEEQDTVRSENFYLQGVRADSLDINNYLSLIWLYETAADNNSRLFGDQDAKYKKVLVYAGAALKLDPSNAYAYNAAGDVFNNAADYGRAIKSYRKAIALDSAYADAQNGLANAYFYSKDYDKAIAGYSKAIEIDPKNGSVWGNRGGAYFSKGDYADALADCQKAVELDPLLVNGYRRMGMIHYVQRNYSLSAVNFKKAEALDPRNPALLNALGNTYYQLQKFDTAVYYQQKAAALAPVNAAISVDLGYAYEGAGKIDLAVTCYQKAIRLDSANTLAYADLGFAFQQLKQYDNAAASFKKAIVLKPGYAPLVNALATVYRDQKNYPEAISYYKKALVIDSTQKARLQDLGLAYIYTRDYPTGINYLRQGLNAYPNDPDALYNMACGYALSGDDDKAFTYLEKALAKGYRDYKHLGEDTDLRALRNDARYAELVKRYFPGKTP